MSGKTRNRDGIVQAERSVSSVLVSVIQLYRWSISPLLGPHCRFTPTCSQYATDVIRKYGPLKGLASTLLRLLKCHPLHPGGYDPA